MDPAVSSDLPPNRGISIIPIHSKADSIKQSMQPEQTTSATQHAKSSAMKDTSSAARRRKLRAKTGCLTCKSRRKKCDEKTPICDRCSLSGRSCTWPATTDLTDRRYVSHPQSRYSSSPETMLCLRSEKTACDQTSFNLEVVLSRHFIDQYYSLLLLPGCRKEFYNGWLIELQELMVDEKSLHYSMLTNAASHIYNIEDDIGMQHRALQYYSKALRSLAVIFSKPKSEHLANDNGLLMTVMLLYLHGCMGRGTYFDIPPHLSAAMRILERRLFDTPPKTFRPFDRLAVESVLFQLFLLNTGLWTERSPIESFDLCFWIQAERQLDRLVLFPGQSQSANSPVLGMPASLYRLVIQAKQMLQHPHTVQPRSLAKLQDEVEFWEGNVLCDTRVKQDCRTDEEFIREKYCESAGHLFALIVSMLSEQISAAFNAKDSALSNDENRQDRFAPRAGSPDCWQIQKAVQILKELQDDDGWTRCYIGNWPVYTLGFFLHEPEHVNLIRKDMMRRWDMTKFTQIPRFRPDLETVWTLRSGLPTVATGHSEFNAQISTP